MTGTLVLGKGISRLNSGNQNNFSVLRNIVLGPPLLQSNSVITQS